MNLERRHSSDLDIEMTKLKAKREFRYSTSKKDIGRDFYVSTKKLKSLIEELEELTNGQTKNHEIGQVNSKFHNVEPKKEETKIISSSPSLMELIDSLPTIDEGRHR